MERTAYVDFERTRQVDVIWCPFFHSDDRIEVSKTVSTRVGAYRVGLWVRVLCVLCRPPQTRTVGKDGEEWNVGELSPPHFHLLKTRIHNLPY